MFIYKEVAMTTRNNEVYVYETCRMRPIIISSESSLQLLGNVELLVRTSNFLHGLTENPIADLSHAQETHAGK